MRYYIQDGDGQVVAKFDGVEVELREGDTVVEVDSVDELSDIDAEWIDYYDGM